ncbi:MAG: hypothetical protein RB292_04335 [Patescibacteria group bacterium]|jgi:hypothetical protein|nr:hypothetical protein [Patescibacteria group bacterium]
MFERKILTTIIIASCLIFNAVILVQAESAASATSIYEQAKSGAQAAIDASVGGGESVDTSGDPFLTGLAVIINSLLTFIGIIFFMLLIYAGFLWMTARGKEEQVDKAKRITREVVIGLIIIVLARIITEFVLTQIGNAIQSTNP